MKDVYYHQFLQLKDLKERFEEELKDEKEVETDKKRQNAIKNFSKRLLEYENNTTEKIEFGDLCQLILTDYNLQNTQKRVRTNKNNKLPDANYEHFPMLLYKCIRKAFIKYVKQEVISDDEKIEIFKEVLKRPKVLSVIVLIAVLIIFVFSADAWQQYRFETANRAYTMMEKQEYAEAAELMEQYLDVSWTPYWKMMELVNGKNNKFSKAEAEAALEKCREMITEK